MGEILSFDSFITSYLAGVFPHNFFADRFFSFFSLQGNSILIWVIVMSLTIYFEERKYPGISLRDKRFTFSFITSFFSSSFLVLYVFKPIFERARPMFGPTCINDYSFPSGHAAAAFSAAAILTHFDPKRRFLYYLVAILISFSRIYLGCHYLLDVVGGALFGYIVSKIILKIGPKSQA